MEGFYDGCCEAAEVFQTYRRAADLRWKHRHHIASALMHVHEQLLKTSARQQMSRYVDIKKLTDKDREILVTHCYKHIFKLIGGLQIRWKHRHHIVPQHLCMCMNNS